MQVELTGYGIFRPEIDGMWATENSNSPKRSNKSNMGLLRFVASLSHDQSPCVVV